jgi:predicted ATPase
VQAVLTARIDRLPPEEKQLLQAAAVIGTEVSLPLLQAIAELSEAVLHRGLAHLQAAEFLYETRLFPERAYTFKHALTQQVAYQSLLTSTRQRYHQQLAQALAARPEAVETQPELLAHHYTEAGLSTQAIPYWQRAGQRAGQRSAHLEAIGHLTKGLDLIKTLPDTPERIQQELMLHTALGVPLQATKGFAAPEVGHVYARARELCRQVGETPQLFPVLWGLWWFYEVRGKVQTARELAEQLLTLTQRQQDLAFLLQAHRAMGQTLFWLGELVLARAHLEQGIALYDPQEHRSLALRYGQDPGVAHRNFAAHVLWYLGYPDQALERIQEALSLGREVSHPFSLAFVLNWAAALHQRRTERLAAKEQAEALVTLATEQGFALRLAQGTILRSWALAMQGQGKEGIAQLHQGLAAYQATGAEVERPYYLALLAEAYGKDGQPEEGLRVLAEALRASQKKGWRLWEADLFRLKGELLLKQAVPGEQEAETCFRQALDIARRQQAKSLELRAAMSFSRHWQRQGKRAEARQLLAPIYSWFTEGFDTPDLQEARVLLEELGGEEKRQGL